MSERDSAMSRADTGAHHMNRPHGGANKESQ